MTVNVTLRRRLRSGIPGQGGVLGQDRPGVLAQFVKAG